MPSADDIARSIEPGSLPYGERGPETDRIRQVMAQKANTQRPKPQPGAKTGRSLDKLASGPVSDKPITSGLSVGPGAGPGPDRSVLDAPGAQKLRLIAENARSPMLRQLARNLLRSQVRNA